MKDDLGDRMKAYESVYTSQCLPKDSIVYVRLDGRSFSNYTRGFVKPFDAHLTSAMRSTAINLFKETNARIAYTQSDEISLILYNDNPESEPYFGYKIHKLVSNLASLATASFILNMKENKKLPTFDCRVCALPNKMEAVNMILWRCQDAARNAITSASRQVFSHNEIQNKSTNDLLNMLKSANVDFHKQYSLCNQFGSFVQKKQYKHYLTPEELNAIPENNRPVEDWVIRNIPHVESFDFRVTSNKLDVVFNNAAPIVE